MDSANEINQDDDTELASIVSFVFSKQTSKGEALSNQKLINWIDKELRANILHLALKILTNQNLDVDPITPQER